MNMDLDRLASEAHNRGEQHFSFTNATGGGQETAKNKGSKGDALKMIQERRDSSNEDSFRSESEQYKSGNYTPAKVSNFNQFLQSSGGNFFNR